METMETINPSLITQVANIGNGGRITPFRWRGLSINVRYSLDLREALAFIDNVMSACTDADTGDFHVEMLDLITRASVVTMFTNIELPADLETQFKILYWTDLYGEIKARINESQLESLTNTIERYINT